MIKSYGELDGRQIDVLREIGNIGAGNAATSLSLLLDEGVTIGIPRVIMLDYNGVIRALGDPEELSVAVMMQYSGDVNGIVLFLLNYKDAENLGDVLIGGANSVKSESGNKLPDMKISMVKEIGNILGCAYLGSIATLTGLNFEISVPSLSIDMMGAIMSAPLLRFSVDDSKVLLVEESFLTDSNSLNSHVLLFADIPSINTVMMKLGLSGE